MAVNTTTLAGIMAASWGNFYDVDRPATSPTPAQLEIPTEHLMMQMEYLHLLD